MTPGRLFINEPANVHLQRRHDVHNAVITTHNHSCCAADAQMNAPWEVPRRSPRGRTLLGGRPSGMSSCDSATMPVACFQRLVLIQHVIGLRSVRDV